MQKVKKIGDIDLDYPLFIKEEFYIKQAKAIINNTLSGGKVVFESVKRDSGNYVTLISKDSGWLKESTIKDILDLLDDIEVETTITLNDDDETEIKVRPALEKGNIVKTSDVVNENGGWFKVEINLCKIWYNIKKRSKIW